MIINLQPAIVLSRYKILWSLKYFNILLFIIKLLRFFRLVIIVVHSLEALRLGENAFADTFSHPVNHKSTDSFDALCYNRMIVGD